MTALLLKTIERIRIFDRQAVFPFALKVPTGVIVLCICEHGDYLDVLYNGRIFSVHKSSVVMQGDQSRRHYSDA
jgi:hypothetical protein